MRHRASAKFWRFYEQLPSDVQRLADKNFTLLKNDPAHESLHFKKVGRFWSARVGIHYRTVAIADDDILVWFWIGRHDHYERIIGSRLEVVHRLPVDAADAPRRKQRDCNERSLLRKFSNSINSLKSLLRRMIQKLEQNLQSLGW